MSDSSELCVEQQDSAVPEPEEHEEKVSENGDGMYLQYMSIRPVAGTEQCLPFVTPRG